MGHPPRHDEPGSVHHVMNRGTAHTMLFRTDRDRRFFMWLLSGLERRFGVQILAFALLGNHYHLVVKSLDRGLSDAMQHVGTEHAQRFNRVHERDGAFFRGRFKSRLVDSDGYLAWLGIYVHLNPVKAGLVEDAVRYRWSSMRSYAGVVPVPPWLHTEDLLAGRSGAEYAELVARHHDREPSTGVEPDDGTNRWPADALPPIDESALAANERSVAELFGVSVDEIYSSIRGRLNVPRMTAIATAVAVVGLDQAQVAARYGLSNARGVRSSLARLRALALEDASLAVVLGSLGLRF